jgi:neutral trehalase
MSHPVSFSECVGHTRFEDEAVLVFATVNAEYRDDRHEVEVIRKAYLTPQDMEHLAEHWEAPWLPGESIVTAGCDGYEASEVARDIFHSWVRQVKESIPK